MLSTKQILAGITAGLTVCMLSSTAFATNIITFEGFDNGQIIDDEYLMSDGVTIRGQNVDRIGNQYAHNVAVIFDSRLSGTEDGDLEAPFYNTNNNNEILDPGNILIIHESPGECSNGLDCGSSPDDEGSRPAGYFEIDFGQAVTLNSIDFFDINQGENSNHADSLITVTGTQTYANFYTPFTGVDNSWDTLNFNVMGVTSIKIKLRGSGAIDNINYTVTSVPAPASLILFALGALGLAARRRLVSAA
jgi:hypothetical protein